MSEATAEALKVHEIFEYGYYIKGHVPPLRARLAVAAWQLADDPFMAEEPSEYRGRWLNRMRVEHTKARLRSVLPHERDGLGFTYFVDWPAEGRGAFLVTLVTQ